MLTRKAGQRCSLAHSYSNRWSKWIVLLATVLLWAPISCASGIARRADLQSSATGVSSGREDEVSTMVQHAVRDGADASVQGAQVVESWDTNGRSSDTRFKTHVEGNNFVRNRIRALQHRVLLSSRASSYYNKWLTPPPQRQGRPPSPPPRQRRPHPPLPPSVPPPSPPPPPPPSPPPLPAAPDPAVVLISVRDYLPFAVLDVSSTPTAGSQPGASAFLAVVVCGGDAAAGAARCIPVCATGAADSSFDDATASLVCRSAGAGTGGIAGPPLGQLRWPVRQPALAALTCPRRAADAGECIGYLDYQQGCSSFATVRCRGATPVRPPPPRPRSKQPAPPLPPPLPTICTGIRQRLQAALLDEWQYRTNLPHGQLQLANGRTGRGNTGLLQLSYCGYLGTVSMLTDQFYLGSASGSVQLSSEPNVSAVNALKAAAVCNTLSYQNSRFKKGSQRTNGGTGVIWELLPVCIAGAVQQTPPVAPGSCPSFKVDIAFDSHDYDLSVDCWNKTSDLDLPPYIPNSDDPHPGALRLMSQTHTAWVTADGNTGYVQIFKDGLWGTICSSGWDDADAEVACHQMGFAAGSAIYIKYDVTQLSDAAGTRWRTMWMTDVDCPTPSKSSYDSGPRQLLDCPHRGAPIEDCPFTELAAVRCFASVSRASPPPSPSPPPPPKPAPTCSTCLLLDLSMDPALGKGEPTTGEAMCRRFAAVASAVVRSLDDPTSYHDDEDRRRQQRRRGGRRLSSSDTDVGALLGFGSPGFLQDLEDPSSEGRGSSSLPVPYSCTNYTDRTMTVCGELAGAKARRTMRSALLEQDDAQVTKWLAVLRDTIGLIQPCQAFDTDYDYRISGLRMTPDVVFSFCDGTNVTYLGMAGTNSLVRTVWVSPPPDAPWAANQAVDFQPPGDSGFTPGPSPPPRPPPKPQPRPLPPPPPRPPAPLPASAPAATFRSCYILVAAPGSILSSLGSNSAVAVLINVTSSGLNMTLESCVARATASGLSQVALEGYSAVINGAIRLTAVCYGLNLPSGSAPPAAAVTQLPPNRCATIPCATVGAAGPKPSCGTGTRGGFALYDVNAGK